MVCFNLDKISKSPSVLFSVFLLIESIIVDEPPEPPLLERGLRSFFAGPSS